MKLEVLKRAREMITDVNRWTTHAAARRADGSRTCSACDDAVQFCGAGSLWRAANELGVDGPTVAELSSFLSSDGLSLVVVNDNQGHAAVLEMYDRAIAQLEKENE